MLPVKPLPNLCNFPWHVKQRIVGYVDPITKLSLRKCSPEFDLLVSQSPVHYTGLELSLNLANEGEDDDEETEYEFVRVKLTLSEDRCQEMVFEWHEDGMLVKNNAERFSKLVPGKHFLLGAVEFFTSIVSKENVSFDKLNVSLFRQCDVEGTWHDLLDELDSSLEQLPRKIPVKLLDLYFDEDTENMLRVLPHLTPDYLHTIRYNSRNPVLDYCRPEEVKKAMDQVVELEQWKKAKRLDIDFCCSQIAFFTQWTHFEKIHVGWRGETVTVDTIKFFIKIALEHPHIKLIEVYFRHQYSEPIINYLNQFETDRKGWKRIRSEEGTGTERVLAVETDNDQDAYLIHNIM